MEQDFKAGASRLILANIAAFSSQCLLDEPLLSSIPTLSNPMQALIEAKLAKI